MNGNAHPESSRGTGRLEADAAVAWAILLQRLVRVARPGSLYPDPSRLLQLLDFCARVAPRKTAAEVTVSPVSGLPALKVLEKLTALREVAVRYLKEHGATPSKTSQGWSAALAAAELPPVVSTSARLVSTGAAGRRFLVTHEQWSGAEGCPSRFTFHLSDPRARYLGLDKKDQARVSQPLQLALEVACRENAEQAYLQLSALDGLELREVVRGQLGPFEAPLLAAGPETPVTTMLRTQPAVSGVLHLVLERAATDVAADRSLDPFAPIEAGSDAVKRRAALGFRVSRERRLCCPAELQRPLQDHLKALGASLIVRSK